MNAKIIGVGAAICAALALGSTANAAEFSFTYTGIDNPIAVHGLLSATLLNGTGDYAITGISGSFSDGAAIAGLVGPGGVSRQNTLFTWDNTVHAGPSLNDQGLLFTRVGDTPGREWNLWRSFGSNYALQSGTEGVGYSLTINHGSFTMAAVPEPEGYAMMLAGLGALGVVARRRKGTSKA